MNAYKKEAIRQDKIRKLLQRHSNQPINNNAVIRAANSLSNYNASNNNARVSGNMRNDNMKWKQTQRRRLLNILSRYNVKMDPNSNKLRIVRGQINHMKNKFPSSNNNSKAVATLANLINGYFPPKLYTRKSNRFKKFFLIK